MAMGSTFNSEVAGHSIYIGTPIVFLVAPQSAYSELKEVKRKRFPPCPAPFLA
jgi:hypothetical protein